MFFINYLSVIVLAFVLLGVVILGVASVPYQGVIALMVVSFFCCVYMVVIGRTFAALVMYIVYLGGLVVVFGYCVSVEKDVVDAFNVGGLKCFFVFMIILVSLWVCLVFGVGGLFVYTGFEDVVCLEVNGGGVFYFDGGVGLMMCSWGLLVVLFSIMAILGWSRLAGFRPF